MLSTFTSYNLINKDLTKSLAQTAKATDVSREIDYYKANIGKIKSIDDFMKNDRIYRFAMKAYGLEDLTYAKAMIRKVLEGGIDDATALANKMSDPRFKALAKAFDFKALGETTTITQAVEKDTVDAYVRQKLEANAGEQSEGVRLALYFQRMASSITSPYGILADKAILKVYQTAFDISPMSSLQSIETQAATVKKMLDVKDLQDPAKVQKIIQKFAAKFDIANSQDQTNPILALFDTNSYANGVTISPDIYSSILNLKRGGF